MISNLVFPGTMRCWSIQKRGPFVGSFWRCENPDMQARSRWIPPQCLPSSLPCYTPHYYYTL